MVTVYDILQHIAQETGYNNSAVKRAGLSDMPAGALFDLRVCMTTDVEASELSYMQRFGRGYTLYFRIRNYGQGQKLAEDLYDLMPNVHPDASMYADDGEHTSGRLYLFIHIRYVPPGKGKLQVSRRKRATVPLTGIKGHAG
jgi:hypothetical protein